jgi:hypothetical protein
MAKEKAGFKETVQNLRGVYLDSWATLASQVASSTTYGRVQNAVTAPGLAAAGLWRKFAEPAVAQALAQWNLPSRAEVISLAGRLTRIETTLDDLAASIDRLQGARTAPVAKVRVVPSAAVRP